MSEVTGTRGSAADSVAVMLEAAQWLEAKGMPLWTREEIQALPERYPADAFLTLYQDGRPCAAALLLDSDPLFWPEVPPGTSGFLHKLSVRRACEGKGLALQMLRYAASLCNNEGKTHLRLDCDASREKLKTLYQNAGFAYLGDRTVRTNAHGTVAAALFERALG